MGKKIVAISSSRVNGNTNGKLVEVGEILKKHGYDFEIIHLMKKNIQECVGCESCLKGDACILKDDAEDIMEKLKGADGVVVSSPVYMFNVGGRLKTFVDRTCKWFHRPELAGKPMLNVITTSGGGLKDVGNYLTKLDYLWGGYPSGNIKRKVTELSTPVQENEVQQFIKNLENGEKGFRPSLNMIITFNVQKILAQKVLKNDFEYWEEKGWIDSHYFYPCKVSVLKKLAGKSFHRMLFKKIKKQI